MTNNINASIDKGFPVKSAGRLSMISMLAISVGMVAMPAHAQDVTPPTITAPAPASSPTITPPQPSPAIAPTTASPPASSPAAAQADAKPPAIPDRAGDLARKGGFDAKTVAPEALAQIESEQRARKAAAAKVATARAKPPARATASLAAKTTADRPDPAIIAPEAISDPASGNISGVAIGTSGSVAAIPDIPSAPPEIVELPENSTASADTDWGLLAALAALLGVGGAGAYAVGRRRKSKGRAAADVHEAEVHGRDPLPAAINEAIMPELRRDPTEPESRPVVNAGQTASEPVESQAQTTTKVAFANFVANLPELEETRDRAHRGKAIGQRRVAAAPRPYLGEADLSRPEGYFMAHVDAMPTPQNPFLTRQNRIKRARALDAKLTEMKASVGHARRKMDREMESPRPLEPAYS